MVKVLTDLSGLTGSLLLEIGNKIASNDVLPLNEYFDKELKIELNKIRVLLNTIERKLQICEATYFTFFDNLDHTALNGTPLTTPKKIELEISYGTSRIKKLLEIHDSNTYKDVINYEFQSYILQFSSLYENLVRLTEILLKKIIVHHKKGKPISSPYYLLLEYWKILTDLSYRNVDSCYTCINSHRPFLDNYTEIMNMLRNRYIHGYNVYLFGDGTEYRIEDLTANFNNTSPELVLDVFAKNVLNNSIQLIMDFLLALTTDMQIPGQKIPM